MNDCLLASFAFSLSLSSLPPLTPFEGMFFFLVYFFKVNCEPVASRYPVDVDKKRAKNGVIL